MASKRRLRRRACLGKVRYSIGSVAQEAARKTSGLVHSRLLAYKCVYCNGYHIGHTPARLRQAAQSRMGATW